MAKQIKGKFIKNNAVDGSKILLRNDQWMRAMKADGSEQDLMKLDASNNLILLKVPQVSVDAVNANDLVRKSMLDTEISARSAAVSALSDRIDSVLANTDEVALNSLAEIVTAFQGADSNLNGAITSLATSASTALSAEATTRAAADLAEQSARAAAVSDLQSQINNLSGSSTSSLSQEISDRIAADSALRTDLDAEVTARIAAIAQELSARQAADSAEQSARVAADLAEQSARIAADSAEQSARIAADAGLQSQMDAEVSARSAADTNLQNQINNILSNTDPAALDSLSEIVTAFQNADSNLNNTITSLGTSASTALGQEVTARQAADLAEQSAREAADLAEQSARIAADSAEAAARQAADTVLQVNLDAEAAARQAAVLAEQSARVAADSNLQSQIDGEVNARVAAVSAEQSARVAAVSALDVRVQVVEAAVVSFAKGKKVLTSDDIDAGYVDLAHKIINESLVASVDRLMIHQDDDYTLSIVGNVTRVTFAGDMIEPSEEKLAAGDVMNFTYSYLASQQVSGGGDEGGGDEGGGDEGGGGGSFDVADGSQTLSMNFAGTGGSYIGWNNPASAGDYVEAVVNGLGIGSLDLSGGELGGYVVYTAGSTSGLANGTVITYKYRKADGQLAGETTSIWTFA
jgi:hypothetical protein